MFMPLLVIHIGTLLSNMGIESVKINIKLVTYTINEIKILPILGIGCVHSLSGQL